MQLADAGKMGTQKVSLDKDSFSVREWQEAVEGRDTYASLIRYGETVSERECLEFEPTPP